jgi:hypothetical protein
MIQTHRQRRIEIPSTHFNDIISNTPDKDVLTVLGNAKASSDWWSEYSSEP